MLSLPEERARLIKEVLKVSRQIGSRNINTPKDVEWMLDSFRAEFPDAAKGTDVDILRLILVQMTGNQETAFPPEFDRLQKLMQQGKALFYKHRFAEAKVLFLGCEKIATQIASNEALAWAKQYLGRIERDSGAFDAAMRLYEEALELAQDEENKQLVAVLYDQMGTTFLRRGDLDEAETYYQMALTTDETSASFVNGNLANLHELRGDSKRASGLVGASAKAYQMEGNQRGEAMTFAQQASASLRAADYTQAAKHALKAHRLATNAEYADVIGLAAQVFETIADDLSAAPDAADKFNAVLRIEWERGDWDIRKVILLKAFIHAVNNNRLPQAAELAWAFAQLAASHGDRDWLSKFRRKRWFRKEPLHWLEQALSQERESRERGSAAARTFTLALAYTRAALGRSKEALALAEEAKALFEGSRQRDDAARAAQLVSEIRARM